MKARIIPPALKRGDVIQVVAPAGRPQSIEPFRSGLAVLDQMGFIVRYPERLWPGSGFLADSDAARAEELNRAFADDRSAAIFAVRGGYGSLRMLGGIDLDLVRAHPKLLVGFSDITLIHNHLLASARADRSAWPGPDHPRRLAAERHRAPVSLPDRCLAQHLHLPIPRDS